MLFILCLVSLTAGAAIAQARRTVTNSDLERYREARVEQERQLREDYVRLGFPSPEELARRNMESQQQLYDLSDRLKAERLERDRLELEREQMMLMMFPPVQGGDNGVLPGDAFYPTAWGLGNGFGRGRGRQQQGYFAGGQFWPQGSRTPARPAFVRPPAPRH
ncbi:MAG: hypothetical protein JO314_10065 [Acidobacteria bacterium]|nr:hypothetical protein [Acidobacteriota bacterium]